MKFKTFTFFTFLLIVTNTGSIQAQYQINSIYSVDVSGGILSETFDKSTSNLKIESCSGINLSLSPEKPLNGSNYSIYTKNGEFVQYSIYPYIFREIPTGEYIIKDGNTIVMYYQKTYTDPFTLYNVILTDDLYNEIIDFSPSYLNYIKLSVAVKNLKKNEINSCSTKIAINWLLNGNVIYDINSVSFVEGDNLCVAPDGVETCTMNCYSYTQRCYNISETLSITKFDNLEDSLKLFPNPTNQFITIQYGNMNKISVLDLHGRTLRVENINNKNEYILDLNTFSSGVYFLKMETESKTFLKKITKE
jgi:hypothetical protein